MAVTVVPTSDAQRVKEAIDIAEIVGEYVSLKPAGINKKALCPFHSEKSPSFHVNASRQRWHCFGCSEGGDAIDFVMKIEGLEFRAALKMLADRAGIVLKPPTKEQQQARTKQEQLFQVVTLAEKFWMAALSKSKAGQVARDYAAQRGLTNTICEQWKIGYAPNDFQTLRGFLHKRGVPDALAVEAGVLSASPTTGKVYDRFRHRLMFPIANAHGQTIGFTGRIIPDAHQTSEQDVAKYMNVPQTPLYDKSSAIFGLYQAKDAIRRAGSVIFTEGQLDVISSHSAGVEHVVAASGTALTVQHIRAVKRFADTVIFAFDTDAAGQKASRKAALLAYAEGCTVKAISLPEGSDPDDIARSHPKTWQSLVASASLWLDDLFAHYEAVADEFDVPQKEHVAEDLLELIAVQTSEIAKQHYMQRLSALVETPVEILNTMIVRTSRQGSSASSASSAVGSSAVQPDASSATRSFAASVSGVTTKAQWFALLLREPALIRAVFQDPREGQDQFFTGAWKPLYAFLQERYGSDNALLESTVVSQAVFETFPTLASRLNAASFTLDTLLTSDTSHTRASVTPLQLCEQLTDMLEVQYVRSALSVVQSKLHEAERRGDTDEIDRLSQLAGRLMQKRSQLDSSHGR